MTVSTGSGWDTFGWAFLLGLGLYLGVRLGQWACGPLRVRIGDLRIACRCVGRSDDDGDDEDKGIAAPRLPVERDEARFS